MVSQPVVRRLRVPNDLAALIRGLHPGMKRKVRAALQSIIAVPDCGKPLKEELAGLRSYRIGRLRIVYRITDARSIEVVAVGPRREIYAETYERLRRENR